jgi:protein-tyrosine phosphatase
LFNQILVVCVGNICRSPMAEAVLKDALAKANRPNCHVSSAGLGALVGCQADPIAIRLMSARGLDIAPHRACQINSEMIRKANLILVMEAAHKVEIENKERSAKGKVFRLGEWGGFDVPDPYRLDLPAFEAALALIDKGVNQWMEKL